MYSQRSQENMSCTGVDLSKILGENLVLGGNVVKSDKYMGVFQFLRAHAHAAQPQSLRLWCRGFHRIYRLFGFVTVVDIFCRGGVSTGGPLNTPLSICVLPYMRSMWPIVSKPKTDVRWSAKQTKLQTAKQTINCWLSCQIIWIILTNYLLTCYRIDEFVVIEE